MRRIEVKPHRSHRTHPTPPSLLKTPTPKNLQHLVVDHTVIGKQELAEAVRCRCMDGRAVDHYICRYLRIAPYGVHDLARHEQKVACRRVMEVAVFVCSHRLLILQQPSPSRGEKAAARHTPTTHGCMPDSRVDTCCTRDGKCTREQILRVQTEDRTMHQVPLVGGSREAGATRLLARQTRGAPPAPCDMRDAERLVLRRVRVCGDVAQK